MVGDRRQTARMQISVPVEVEGLLATRQATIKNFSVYGMCYSLPAEKQLAPEEKEVFLTFSLLDRIKPIRVMGWIVYTRPNGDNVETGVTFMFLSPSDEEILRDFGQRQG